MTKFTGKERDTESGLDNFGARYDSSSIGRFMTPDDFHNDSHVGDPQSWNEYAYARNNPLRYTDPTGETATHNWKQPPSPADRAAALPGQINIVFGARDHKVYFYNSAGDIGKPMKLKDFLP